MTSKAQTVSAYQSTADVYASATTLNTTDYSSHWLVLETSAGAAALSIGGTDPYGSTNGTKPVLSIEFASGQMSPATTMYATDYSFTATDYYPILIGYHTSNAQWQVLSMGSMFTYAITTTVSIVNNNPATYSIQNGDDLETYTLYYESSSYYGMVNSTYSVTTAPYDAGITTTSGSVTANIGSSMSSSNSYIPVLVNSSGTIVAIGSMETITVPISFSVDVSTSTPTYSITGGDDAETYTLYYETSTPSYSVGSSYTASGSTISNTGITTSSAVASGNVTYLTSGTYYGVLVATDIYNISTVVATDISGFVILENTALGINALTAVTTGSENTAIGANALSSNTEGSYNTSIGRGSLPNNIDGNYNTASGYQSLQSNTEGNNNTASGTSSLYSNTTGYRNTAYGEISLYSNNTGAKNTGLGYSAQASSATAINQTIIGYEATGQADNSVVLGNDDVTAVYMAEDRGAKIYAGEGDFSGDIVTAGNVTVSSDIRLKKDIVNLPSTIDNIKSLRPVSYNKKNSLSSEEYGSTEIGLIAQELQE
ncbi:MAG: tail fiber domain-containing protein, partial [Flavobacteriales bacterium]|nr:tail fiber domain-containing protein [Flavobacteriales bacterium]